MKFLITCQMLSETWKIDYLQDEYDVIRSMNNYQCERPENSEKEKNHNNECPEWPYHLQAP